VELEKKIEETSSVIIEAVKKRAQELVACSKRIRSNKCKSLCSVVDSVIVTTTNNHNSSFLLDSIISAYSNATYCLVLVSALQQQESQLKSIVTNIEDLSKKVSNRSTLTNPALLVSVSHVSKLALEVLCMHLCTCLLLLFAVIVFCVWKAFIQPAFSFIYCWSNHT
jgi:hypothetical protein